MKLLTWNGCYDLSWKGFITPASFAHPAKMSRGLLERIIAHGFEKGYWVPPDKSCKACGFCLHSSIHETNSPTTGKEAMPIMRQDFHASRGENQVLSEEMRLRMVISKQKELQGRKDGDRPRVCGSDKHKPAKETEVCDGTSDSNGECNWKVAEKERNSSPQKRRSAGQSNRKPRTDDQAQTRQDGTGRTKPKSDTDVMPVLRGQIHNVASCPNCNGRIEQGSVIGDAFGGIGTTGIIGAYHGMRVVSVELEKKFVSLARRNYALHSSKWKALGSPRPVILQGDSRAFHVLAGKTDSVLASPPYAGSVHDGNGIDASKLTGNPAGPNSQAGNGGYGQSAGQIGALKAGSVDGVVSSPPFLHARSDTTKSGRCTKGGPCQEREQSIAAGREGYGSSPGQIDSLPAGTVQGVVTSPPWEKNCEGVMKASKFKDPAAFAEQARKTGHDASLKAKLKAMVADESRDSYGESPGQIGKESGETYWQAMNAVYHSCYQAIKPGGVLVLVVKDYVKAGKRVPLCDDTVRLIEHIGFQMVERVHAMLVKETVHADLFGADIKQTSSRKSFFRRLAEKKGSPAIDYEEVLFARKPL